MRRMLRLATAAALILLTACTTVAHRVWPARDFARGDDRVVLADDGVVLQVVNKSRTDVEIFVIDDGVWRDIGFVGAVSTARLDVSGLNDSGAPLRMLATPVGGGGSARVGPLTVLPGQVVTFTIEADLARSSATVR